MKKCLSNLLNYENLQHHRHFCGTKNICIECNLQFLKTDHLSNHLKWYGNGGPKEYIYVKCNYQMFNEDNLNHHSKICGYFSDTESHQCKICDKYFYSRGELSSHLIRCGKFICYECSAPFISSNALNYHIEIYHRPKKTNKQYIYLFGVLRRFQHCIGHITTGSWKGRGNQYIQLVHVLNCKLPTNGK